MCQGLNANGALAGGRSVPRANEPDGPAKCGVGRLHAASGCTRNQFLCDRIFSNVPTIALFLLTPQVGSESSHDAQVLLAAGLHGYYPALPRSDQVFWLHTLTTLSFLCVWFFFLGLYYNCLFLYVCSLDLFFTWLFDVNFLDERNVKFQ